MNKERKKQVVCNESAVRTGTTDNQHVSAAAAVIRSIFIDPEIRWSAPIAATAITDTCTIVTVMATKVLTKLYLRA